MFIEKIITIFIVFCLFCQTLHAQQTPQLSINLPDEGDIIFSADISNDQKFLLTGSRKPILWDVETGEKLLVFDGHDEFDSSSSIRIGVLSTDISSDLSTVVSGDSRLNIVISRFNNCQAIFKIKSTNLNPSGGGIVGVAVMPDNKRVLSANGNGTMEMWNIETGELINKYSKGGIKSIILLNDGKRVIMDLGVTIVVFDLDTSENLFAFEGSFPSISNDNLILQFFGPNQTRDGTVIKHISINTGETIREFPLESDVAPTTIDISPDGKNFLIGNTIRNNGATEVLNRVLFDAITPGPIRTYNIDLNADANSPDSEDRIIKYFPFGRKFLTVNGNAVHIWDISDVVTRVDDAALHWN